MSSDLILPLEDLLHNDAKSLRRRRAFSFGAVVLIATVSVVVTQELLEAGTDVSDWRRLLWLGTFVAVEYALIWKGFRLLRVQTAQMVVAGELFGILHDLEAGTLGLRELDHRMAIVRRLERAAATVERDLRSKLKTGDRSTDGWVEDATRRIAAGLRELKLWVLSPTPLTHDDLVHRLNQDVLAITNDQWQLMTRAGEYPPKPTTRSLVVRRLVGLAPLLTIVVVLRFQQPEPDPVLAASLLSIATVASAYISGLTPEPTSVFGQAVDVAGKLGHRQP